MAEGSPILVLKDVGIVRGGRRIVHRFSLNVRPADRVLVSGPAGCGKSTLLRVLCGLESPSEGTRCEERNLGHGHHRAARQAAGQLRVAAAMSEPGLVPDLTVEENILLTIESSEGETPSDLAACDHAISVFGLSRVRHRLPAEISPGLQHQTALARACVMQPDVLVIDDVYRNIDIDTDIALSRIERYVGQAAIVAAARDANAFVRHGYRIVSVN